MAETLKAPFYRKLGETGGMMFIHPCCICGDENAGFGFGVSLLKGKPGKWYCSKHKDQADG